jgi:hypothetical protein
VALDAAYAAAGTLGISVLGMVVSALIVVLLWASVATTLPGRVAPILVSSTVVVAVLSALPLWTSRAQLLDLAAILGMTLAWSLYLRRGQSWVLAAVPLICAAWANLHGSGVLAFVACVLALVVAVPVGARWGTWSRPTLWPLVLSTIAGLLAPGRLALHGGRRSHAPNQRDL